MNLRHELANYAHEAWRGWMRYLFELSKDSPNGEVVIPAPLVQRWTRQINTAYDHLPEAKRDSDLREADKMLEIMGMSS